jgi:hypothetical protein
MRAHQKPTFGVEIARASDKLIAHERQLLADCEDAELVGLPEKDTRPLASYVLSSLEGAILLSSGEKSIAPIERSPTFVVQMVRAKLPKR